jgi:hypothetical protein
MASFINSTSKDAQGGDDVSDDKMITISKNHDGKKEKLENAKDVTTIKISSVMEKINDASSSSSSDDSSSSSSDDDDTATSIPNRRGMSLKSTSSPSTQTKEMILGRKYQITVPKSIEIGISWETNWEGKQTMVKSFHRIDGGKHGPAKLSGKVNLQDILISINGIDVSDEDHHETLKRLRSLNDDEKILRFCEPASESSSTIVNEQEDAALRKVKLEIHEHKIKFYEAHDEKEELRRCYVQIYEGTWLTHFHMHLESDQSFIIAASCNDDMLSGFVFHTMADMTWNATMQDIPTDPHAHSYLGQMVSNFSGTTFTMHDYRVIEPDSKDSNIHELGYVMYDVNILGRVPNSLKAVIPRFDEQYLDYPQQHTIAQRITTQNTEHSSLDYTIIDQLTFKKDHKYNRVETKEEAQLLFLQTKKPIWVEEHEAW